MKLKELFESDDKDDFIRDIQILKTECSDFLQQFNGNPLYRGMHKSLPTFYKMAVRKDREAANSGRHLNFVFNIAIEKLSNVPEIRKKSLFATMDPKQAGSYGQVYAIFPVNGYKIVYSSRVRDIMSRTLAYRTRLNDFIFDMSEESNDAEKLEKYINSSDTFTIDGLGKILTPENTKKTIDFVTKIIKSDEYEIINRKLNSEDLNEMIVFNCDNYYSIRLNALYNLFPDLENEVRWADEPAIEFLYKKFLALLK